MSVKPAYGDRKSVSKTSILPGHLKAENMLTDQSLAIETIDIGVRHPWRFGILIEPFQVELVTKLLNVMTIGRTDERGGETSPTVEVPHIDLSPFLAEEMGVSRQHVLIKWEDSGVVVVDKKSLNGTYLNGRWLEAWRSYSLKHGDQLTLGALALRIHLMTPMLF